MRLGINKFVATTENHCANSSSIIVRKNINKRKEKALILALNLQSDKNCINSP